MPHIRILIADDHPEMLSALVSVLEDDPRFDVVGSAMTGGEAYRLARETPVDAVLLDVHMPDGGPAAAEALTALARPPVVVAISAQSAPGAVEEMLRAGAVGYLAKDRVGGALGDLVARCVAGEVVLATAAGAGTLRALITAPVRAE